jgi:subtilisin-like proprotein convertase family protein
MTAILFLTGIQLHLRLQDLHAQTFTGTGGHIKDNGEANTYSLKVSGLPKVIGRDFGLEKVCVDIQHTWDEDVSIFLVAPDGRVGDLFRRNGDSKDDITDCCLTQKASVSANSGRAPFTGDFLPEVSFGGLNDGQDPNGIWKLVIIDTEPENESGKLLSWKLVFSEEPATPYMIAQSKLPIVMINSLGQVVRDEPKTKVRFGIIDNGPGKKNHPSDSWNAYNGYVGMEFRGKSSQRHSKLSFMIQTRDSSGEKAKAATFLDFPEETDFVLIANFPDKSLVRNYLTHAIYGEMGHYAPRVRFVDVIMDGEYRGVYLLAEKIKQGKDRVDIARLDSDNNAGDSLTGGYIIKNDWEQGSLNDGWESKFTPMESSKPLYWMFHYPEPDKITDAQREYIHAYVDSFELACDKSLTDDVNGYPHFIDVQSFLDMFIIVELAKNVDGYWVSSFYFKDRNSRGGKLSAGPIWDYDLGYGNFEYYYGYAPNGWHWEEYGITSDHIPQWWGFLAKDPKFQNQLRCRWTELRKTVLSKEHLFALVDGAIAQIDESQGHNFQVWKELGQYTWPNAMPYEKTHAGEVRRVKEWLVMRMAWMDEWMQGTCD